MLGHRDVTARGHINEVDLVCTQKKRLWSCNLGAWPRPWAKAETLSGSLRVHTTTSGAFIVRPRLAPVMFFLTGT